MAKPANIVPPGSSSKKSGGASAKTPKAGMPVKPVSRAEAASAQRKAELNSGPKGGGMASKKKAC